MKVLKFIAHSKKVIRLAVERGWHPGARYTNLRDVREFRFEGRGFLDINWKRYSFKQHLAATKLTKPKLTIARDVELIHDLDSILSEAERLRQYAEKVAIVPKDPKLANQLEALIPNEYLLAYSVPTKYGGTKIPPSKFRRRVHLLGGRPDIQRRLAEEMEVISFDCNRFTFDAQFGKYFNGVGFSKHPFGGYENCLTDSIKNINSLWDS